MRAIEHEQKNMINGVTQQPTGQSLPTQCKVQENALSSPAEGLKKRYPTEWISSLTTDTDFLGCHIHFIHRDSAEKYVILISKTGSVKVFDLTTGAEKTVSGALAAYLATADPTNDLASLTIADYTFINNKNKVVAMDSATTPSLPKDSLVFVRAGNYDTTYKLTVKDVTNSYTTWVKTSPSDAEQVQTSWIAQQLADKTRLGTAYVADPEVLSDPTSGWVKDYVAGGTGGTAEAPSGITFKVIDYVIHIDYGVTDYTVKVEGGHNDAVINIQGQVQRIGDLPQVAPHGFKVEIRGEANDPSNSFWVSFVADDAIFSGGLWEECPAPSIKYQLDASTMPCQLVREFDGTFTLSESTWGQRTSGDNDSVPEPTFVGRKISNMSLHESRLGLLAGESCVNSKAGEFFEFFRTSAIQTVDDDPVDAASGVDDVKHALSYNEQLLLFSEKGQFVLSGDGNVLTPSTARMKASTAYQSNPKAAPIQIGRSVMFASSSGEHGGVSELVPQPDIKQNKAESITRHVGKYISGEILEMTGSNENLVLFVRSSKDTCNLNVYQYYDNNTERLQSSWSINCFDADVVGIKMIHESLYILFERDSEIHLECMRVDDYLTDLNSEYVTRLDGRLKESEVSPTYSGGKTVFTTPYDTPKLSVAVRANSATLKEGDELLSTKTGPKTFTVDGDVTGESLYLGKKYLSRYRYSPVVRRHRDNSPITSGITQVLSMEVKYTDTGYFEVATIPRVGDAEVHTMSGNSIGINEADIGKVNLQSGLEMVSVRGVNDEVDIEIRSDSFLPFSIQSSKFYLYQN